MASGSPSTVSWSVRATADKPAAFAASTTAAGATAPSEAVECVWRNITEWGTALAWWTVRFVGDEGDLVPHPVEVSEILWLSAEEMLEHPDLLQGNRPFLEAVIEGRLRV